MRRSGGYVGPGAPQYWASLSEEYAACGDGKQQSPIDITGYEEGAAEPISFSYGTDATAVRNDGKAVHVDYGPGKHIEHRSANLRAEVGTHSLTLGASE